MKPQDLEFIRQQHEVFLSDLETLSLQALASGNWDGVLAHINQVRLMGNDLSDRFNSQEDFFAFLTEINELLILGEASTNHRNHAETGTDYGSLRGTQTMHLRAKEEEGE